jgi:hypothetical protein
MGIGTEELEAIDAMLTAKSASVSGGESGALADFRRRFPALSLTRCDASDMDAETPFRVYAGVSLFLVDASDHCWRITSDPARATGVVVARHKFDCKGCP